MRYRPGHKQRTHGRIVAEAAAALRRDGVRGATVERVMTRAGLSHGGFYAHFSSKDDMAAAGLAAAFAETRAALFGDLGDATDEDWIHQVMARYLGRAHRDAEDAGCPLPHLAGELARARGSLKHESEQGLEDYAAAISTRLAGGGSEGRSNAYALLALMVGGIALARVAADPGLSDQILRACRRVAQDLAAASS
ncbi:MAG: TetR/AcrR family transcriptional regulator [Proteobacteria bacterium]|nr:TetR/AcrR family transcriptional regulator [Pseudomonadota bacterium]